MRKIILISLVLILLILISCYFLKFSQRSQKIIKLNLPKIMKLESSSFENNGFIPEKYTCDGQDISPPLTISDVPENAKSLVLIVDDPDAPMGTWDHWILWNIDPKTKEIKEGETPQGAVEGINSFKKYHYGGPCPPFGTHHYHFKLFALKEKLNLDPNTNKKELEKAMEGLILDEAELIGLYKRK